MNLNQIFERFANTWKNMPSSRKTGLLSFVIVLTAALLVYYFVFGKTTYVALFNNLDINNSGKVVQKLDEKGVTKYKLENGGSTILVPSDQVDKLRIDLAIDGALPTNGTGFEIFDSSSFAITDEDRKIMYQRALEGELQRTISSFEEVSFARVHLSLPEDSVFSREEESGSATVMIQLKAFSQLNSSQIRGVISLVSGAIKGIPEANVRVIDSNANLLSVGVLDEDRSIGLGIGGMTERFEMKRSFESEVENRLKDVLERTFGKGKVAVSVNADLNYDSEEQTSIFYDKDNNVIRSEQERLLVDSGADTEGRSPVDNNIQYYSSTSAAAINGINTFETIKNYEISETTTRVVRAPGELLRMTTSVVYDGSLNDAMKESIRNIVIGAVGFNDVRSDLINIEGIAFDRTYEEQVAIEMKEQLAVIAKEEKINGYIQLGLSVLGGIILLIMFITFMRKRKKNAQIRALEDANMLAQANNGTLEAGGQQVQPVGVDDVFDSISLSLDSESAVAKKEKEVNAFVEKDPEKVAEIVKTWILKEET